MSRWHPKPRKYKKWNRKAIRRTYEGHSNRLRFGQCGIQATERGFIKPSHIEAVRRYITNRLKRRGRVWIRALPDYPRTAKPREVRMGRGKGAVAGWVSIIKPGRVLFEVSYKDQKLLRHALDFVTRKLPMRSRVIFREEEF